jgi:two-component system, OmpR family, sensor histidine kinase KdpD
LIQATSVIERTRLHQENLKVEVLQRTDTLRSALLSSVSHDLRTPLASIKAAASSLLQEDVHWDEETRRNFVFAIEQEADRLNRLVGNLLDMSRIEAGALKLEKEWYLIDALLHDVLNHMQLLLQGREVRVSLPDDLPPVQLDYVQMDQVFTNLIENATRYTPPGSLIEISAKIVGNEILISVADHGSGIPPDDLERIFDKFYRVLGTPRKGTSAMGSGLGLAVCRGLVEAHGGRIWAENRKEGGAIFRLTLPLEREA